MDAKVIIMIITIIIIMMMMIIMMIIITIMIMMIMINDNDDNYNNIDIDDNCNDDNDNNNNNNDDDNDYNNNDNDNDDNNNDNNNNNNDDDDDDDDDDNNHRRHQPRHNLRYRDTHVVTSLCCVTRDTTYKCSRGCYATPPSATSYKNRITIAVNKYTGCHGAHGHFAGFDEVGGGGWETEAVRGSRGREVIHLVIKHDA